MKRRWLSILAALALCLGLLPGTALAEDLGINNDNHAGIPDEQLFSSGAGTAEEPYLISDLSELEAFRDSVNSGTTYAGEFIRLTADIDMSEKYGNAGESWTPIGKAYSYPDAVDGRFKGTFDGGDHRITGLYVNSDQDYVGLFGWGENCVIKNLTMENGEVTTTAMYAGAVIGILNGSVINCHNRSVKVTARRYAGGIVGQIETSLISDGYTPESTGYVIEGCSNMADICGTGYAECGGIVSLLNAALVTNCLNLGNLDNGSSGLYCGGIVGMNQHGAVSNCFSMSDITPSAAYPNNAGGGIVGRVDSREYAQNVTNCFYITNENLYGIGRLSGDMPGGAERVTAERLTSGEIAYLLQQAQKGGQVWGQNLYGNAPDPKPVLSADLSEKVIKVDYVQTADVSVTQYINAGQRNTVPPEPAPREELEFQGWYTQAGGGAKFDFSTPITEDLTLYARWAAAAIHVTGVSLNKTDLTLTAGDSEQLTATVAPGDAADKTVIWASSDTAVAMVDESGNVAAIGEGTATITVTTADGGKTAVCTVTVRSGGGYVPPFPSDPSTPSTPGTPSTSGSSAVTVPVSGGQSTVRVSASVSGSTAAVRRIDTAQIDRVVGDGGQAGMVEIDFTGLGGDIDTVTLPAGAVKDIAAKAQNEEIGGLTVRLPGGEVSFDAKALAAIQNQAGSQITLAVTRVKSGGLNDRQKEAAGGAPVFELTLRGGSGAVIDFSGGHATVSLPYELTAGQDPDRVVVYHLDSAGNITPCDTRYDVRTGSAVFTTGHFALYFVGYDTAAVGESLFSDVAGDAWHYDAVRFVSENGLMGGYGNGLFGPDDNLSRAQFAQILHNREGRPVVNYLMQFGDVSGGAWYAEAVRWAAAQGIAGGHDDGMFGPDENITREQLAVMLWRYAGCPAAAGRELDLTDAGEASGYALDALRWAVEKEIINGSGGGQLAPKGLATRAQAAQMLMNFLKNA